jgi:ribosome maturation factor RimP
VHGARGTAGRGRGRTEAAQTGQAGGDQRRTVDLAAVRGRVRAIVEPAVVSAGLDLDDLTVSPAGRRLVVRVTVDGDDVVSHDELTAVSREISARLDAAEETGGDVTPDSYTLEVSSPGVDRPLTLPRHWRRNVGRLVKVKAGDRSLTGRVTTVDEAGVSLDVDGRGITVGFTDLGPGRVQIEFTRLAEEDFGHAVDDEAEFDDDDLDGDDEGDDDELDEDELDEDELDEDDEDDHHEDGDSRDGRDGDTHLDLDEPQQKEDGA